MEFKCNSCDKIFNSEEQLKEYMHAIYGACRHMISFCPDCGKECSEYVKPKPQKLKVDYAPSCAGSPNCNNCCYN